MKRILLEVAVESFDDAIAAVEAGADRIELCVRLSEGGLTAPLDVYVSVRETVGVPIVAMIRPLADESFLARSVLPAMLAQIAERLVDPPAAFVFGALMPDRSIDRESCQTLIDACRGVPADFHRAWDVRPRGRDELEMLIDLGFRRLLTSGSAAHAEDGISAICDAVEWARGRLEILPGSGIGPHNAEAILRGTGCDQLHGTFRRVDFVGDRVRVDPDRVRAVRAVLDQFVEGAWESGGR